MKRIYLLLALLFCVIATPSYAAPRFAICATTCTWDNASNAMWSTNSGGATGAAAPTSADDVTLDASTCTGGTTCTITVNANLNIKSLTMGACTASTTGCVLDFSVNNNSISVGAVTLTGSGTRVLRMGSNTWTITNTTGSVWANSTTTGETLTAGTSTLLFSATATGVRSLLFGGVTYNNITVTNAAQDAFMIDAANGGNWTAANLTLTNVLNLRLNSAGTQTITGTFTYNNGGGPKLGMIYTNGVASTLSVAGATTFNNAVVQNITKAGAGSIAVTNGYDGGGNNTGASFTITNPSTGGGRIIGG